MTPPDELVAAMLAARDVPPNETKEQERGRTIREAIDVAMEGLRGAQIDWAVEKMFELREYVLRWVHEYARNRGVELSDEDIDIELTAIIAAIHLRGR